MTTFTKEQLIEQARKNIEVLRGAVERIPGASDAAVIHLKLAEITLAALGTDTRENPVLAYADSYRSMAMQGVESIPILNVITDLERNIAPLYTYTPTPESEDRKMLKRLAVIMSGSDSGGEISALTVTAQSLVDRCKALARGKEKLAATESLALGVKCPFPYGWEELKRRTNQDTLFFSAYMVEGEEVTDLHRDIVDRMVDRLLKVIAACQTDASYSGPTTCNPASLEEVNKRSVRESTDTDFPFREGIIVDGVLVECPRCHGDAYRLHFNGWNYYRCDKCANAITSEGK